MTSLFQGAVQSARETIFGVFSESVVYTRSADNTSLEIDAIFNAKFKEVKLGNAETSIMSTCPVFEIKLSDLAPTAPKQGDTLERSEGDSYEVERIEPDGFGSVRLFVVQS